MKKFCIRLLDSMIDLLDLWVLCPLLLIGLTEIKMAKAVGAVPFGEHQVFLIMMLSALTLWKMAPLMEELVRKAKGTPAPVQRLQPAPPMSLPLKLALLVIFWVLPFASFFGDTMWPVFMAIGLVPLAFAMLSTPQPTAVRNG